MNNVIDLRKPFPELKFYLAKVGKDFYRTRSTCAPSARQTIIGYFNVPLEAIELKVIPLHMQHLAGKTIWRRLAWNERA